MEQYDKRNNKDLLIEEDLQKICLEKMVDDCIHNGEMESSPTILGIDLALAEHGMEHMRAEVRAWSAYMQST